MAEAIVATGSVPIVETTAGQSALRAGSTPPATANNGAAKTPATRAAPVSSSAVTPPAPANGVQVAAQLTGSDIGPEGRLMQLLRALNPPVPPPIVPPPRSVTA